MADERVNTEQYEPPRLDDRAPIAVPLIGLQSSQATSAAFRPF